MSVIHAVNVCAIACLGFAIRSIVSLHPYSGKGNHPMYGDYEAQRHWQEITVNLPINEWYRNTTRNDLGYWGLDYPPLTAYHSWLVGKVASHCNKSFVELYTSRGYESSTHKQFMRLTVLVADLLIYIPAVWLATEAIFNFKKKFSRRLWGDPRTDHLLVFLLYPGQILIDNGHFQYNNISLGFALLAISCILYEKKLLASFLFCLAINYKQMELYHAMPFFIYLLRTSMINSKSYFSAFRSLMKIGLVVILTFGILWLPWIITLDVQSVLHRMFPIARGVFEDKVSNFWCVLNNFVKIKKIYSNESMVVICLCSTLLGLLPSSIHLFLYPEKLNFVYALVNSSLSFFLFSYQVHEKSILLPVLPILLLFPIDPFAVIWFLQISTFSIFPLLVKDGLTLAYIATSILFYSLCNIIVKDDDKKLSKLMKFLMHLSYGIAIILAIAHENVPAPDHLPHLYPVLISMFSFSHFLLFKLYFNYKQICGN